MGSRREEERNEKIIRGLMKLPPNRRCINCNILGPQYVCTNFWTFVCMTCSGIHREFTHRVKSVSMSKFTSQEVELLQAGGNQRAREFFLKHWDIQRTKLPDNSKPEKVREFIKSVYVDQKYTGGTISSPVDDSRRASSYHSYSQSPPYDFQYEDRVYGKHKRKPDRYLGKISSFVMSPTRFSEDKFANESTTSRASDFSVSTTSHAGSPTPHGYQLSCVASHQEPPVDLFKLPGAPASPFKADSLANLSSSVVIQNQVSELSGWANFDLVQPTEPVKELHQSVTVFQSTKPIEDHHQDIEDHRYLPVNSLALSNFKPFQETEQIIGHCPPPIDNQALDFHHQPESALGLKNLNHFQPAEPTKNTHNNPVDHFQPVSDVSQQLSNLLALQNFDPVHPTEPLKDHHLNVLPFNDFGSVQATELMIASNNIVLLEDLFSSSPAYSTKISAKSINPFDDIFESDSATQIPVYAGSMTESWFGSEVEVNHAATQMGNLSVAESVVCSDGNPFA